MASITLFSLSYLPLKFSHSAALLPLSFSSAAFTATTFRSNHRTSAVTATTSTAQPMSEFNPIADVGVGEDLPEAYAEYFPNSDPSDRRRAGILLHPTSLPGPHGIGDLGDYAFRFIDWLHSSGCSLWQVLPLVPPGRKDNEEGSPYSGQDANCGNTLLISLEELVKDGLLTEDELPKPIEAERVNFAAVAEIKDPLVAKAAERLIMSKGELKDQLENFRRDPSISSWLEDAAYFAAIDNVCNTFSWYDWPEPLKNRHLSALEKIYQTEKDFVSLD